MPRSIQRTYSYYTLDAVRLLGGLIREARKERRLTQQETAERASISRGMLQRIEKGDLKCEIGAVFETAALVGVQLFEADQPTLRDYLHRNREKLALLPRSIREKPMLVKDDF